MNVRAIDNSCDAQHAAPARRLWVPLVAAWLLGMLTFSVPGRTGPDTLGALDPIALAKVGARAAVLLAGMWVMREHWHHPRRRLVTTILMPFALFVGWAILSVAWSPLKAVSLGQAGGLAAQLMLAGLIGVTAAREADSRRILAHVNWLLLAAAAMILAVNFVSPEMSGLNRDLSSHGSVGLVHPSSAGATASIGLVLLVVTWLVWNPSWCRWLLVPGIMIYGVLLLNAASRTALAVAVMAVGTAILLLMERGRLATVVLAVCVLVVGYLCLDPALELFGSTYRSGTQYLRRDESDESLQSLTGRTELWAAVWGEFCHVPLHGCGYFVTSQNGLLDVWTEPANRTGHNVMLQVLVSTGLIGGLLFLWALGRIVFRVAHELATSAAGRKPGLFLVLVSVWYLGWGQLCSSFMGPIQLESVVFFTCLGLALARLRAPTTDPAEPVTIPQHLASSGAAR